MPWCSGDVVAQHVVNINFRGTSHELLAAVAKFALPCNLNAFIYSKVDKQTQVAK